MTDEELRTLVASLATSTANNAAEAHTNTEAIRELRLSSESRFEALERQGQTMLNGLASLQASSESQLRSIESMRESITYNVETMASALELAAISQRTAAAAQESAAASQQLAAEALQISANTSRNLDRLELNIDRLEAMMGIIIRDNQADRTRISRLEDQD
jgi:methyl-accepting chemotaxis protein